MDDVTAVYDGPGLSAGTMDVQTLAPALLGFAALFQEANRITNPTAPEVALHIEATGGGSFHIHLQLLMHSVDAGKVLLAGGAVTALANAKALVIDPASGLIGLLLRRRREPAVEPEALLSGEVIYEWSDGAVRYPAGVIALDRSLTIRRELQVVASPLASEGCDELRLSSTTTETIVITTDDLPALLPPESGDPPEAENTVTMTLSVVAPSFDRKKWRVSDGSSTFWVGILDETFQARIDAREPFAKGDFLRSRVRYAQYKADTPSGLRVERDILEVLEHSQPSVPPTLGI